MQNEQNNEEILNKFRELNYTISEGLISILSQFITIAEKIAELEKRIKNLEDAQNIENDIQGPPGFSLN